MRLREKTKRRRGYTGGLCGLWHSEESQGPHSLYTARAAEALATFCRARRRYPEAEEELYRRSLTVVEEDVSSRAAMWTKGWRPWRNKKELQIRLSLNQIPISTSLDHLATVYEDQQKYTESEPLRRRSVEIKERAWGERHRSFLRDSGLATFSGILSFSELGFPTGHDLQQSSSLPTFVITTAPKCAHCCSLRHEETA